MRTSSFTASGVAVIIAVSGCGPAAAPPAQPTASERSTASASSANAPTVPQAIGTIIDVSIADGAVAPVNAEVRAVAGQPIVLKVGSDATDSIHVHSVPEYVFEIQPRPDQRFEFTVDVPGRVDVELHDLNRTIVTITVRP